MKCHLHHIVVIDEVPEIPSPFVKSLEEDLYQHNEEPYVFKLDDGSFSDGLFSDDDIGKLMSV